MNTCFQLCSCIGVLGKGETMIKEVGEAQQHDPGRGSAIAHWMC